MPKSSPRPKSAQAGHARDGASRKKAAVAAHELFLNDIQQHYIVDTTARWLVSSQTHNTGIVVWRKGKERETRAYINMSKNASTFQAETSVYRLILPVPANSTGVWRGNAEQYRTRMD